MGLWLVKSRRWRALRFPFLVALLALSLGAPPGHVKSQSQGVAFYIQFDPRTPPVKLGVICKGQNYVILALPLVHFGEVAEYEELYNRVHAHIRVYPATVGTIIPTGIRLLESGPAAFIYKSDNLGKETLTFVVETGGSLRGKTAQGDEVELFDSTAPFEFEVQECQYKVSMTLTLGINSRGTNVTLTGEMPDTPLAMNKPGEFVADAQFKFKHTATVPGCTFSFSGFDSASHIEGKLTSTGFLELILFFGKGTESQSGTCPNPLGAAYSGPQTFDIARLVGVTKVQFPVGGGIMGFPLPKIPAGSGNFVITVKKIGSQ
jgi:hypothetical protein